ncbi:MAG: AMP-binding protein [Pirellulaceae bacterium]
MTSDSSLLPVLWDEQAGDKPFVQLFVDQVARTPDALAVEFEGRRVTYRQLNERANQLAHHLVGLGLGDEARVGICLDRSISAIECMIGILKAGCAFVPLDPEFPQDRLAYIAEHAGISLIFADGSYRDRFTEQERRGVDVVSPDETALTAETSAPNVGLSAHNLAYVMYTSGSTGKPKGVQIEHGNLTTYCLADARIYQLRSDDRTLQFSTLNFDIAIEEIFPPLLTGGAVIVRPRSRSRRRSSYRT